jgi:hypothetical protein
LLESSARKSLPPQSDESAPQSVMIKSKRVIFKIVMLGVLCALSGGAAFAQSAQEAVDEEEFGPVVRAYLGYLRDEQEVVDDRVSRREISPAY